MATSKSTAQASDVTVLVKTALTTANIETILDNIVYPLVDGWVGAHSLDDASERIRSAEAIMAAYFVRQRDPMSVKLPGVTYAFSSYEKAERIAMSIINRAIPYDKAIRVVNPSDTEADYILRDPDAPRTHKPPF